MILRRIQASTFAAREQDFGDVFFEFFRRFLVIKKSVRKIKN